MLKLQPSDRSIVKGTTLGTLNCKTKKKLQRPTHRQRVVKATTTLGPLDCTTQGSYNTPTVATVGSCHVAQS